MTASSPGTPRIGVLHVVEAYGGGVMVAVNDYISGTRDVLQHNIVAAKRDQHDTGSTLDIPMYNMGERAQLRRVIGSVRDAIWRSKPDIIHFHSSWAAVISRFISKSGTKFVYTPHCYAFERTDVSRVTGRALYFAETYLAKRFDSVISCSPREAELAVEVSPGAQVHYVPNVARGIEREAAQVRTGEFHVVGAGRVMAQKGPDWFGEVARITALTHPQISFSWLGGGDSAAEEALRSRGVAVSGWVPRDVLLQRMRSANIYLHSAAWEGSPLSILEAASLGLPLMGRKIPALNSLRVPNLFESPRNAAEALIERNDNASLLPRDLLMTQRFAARHSVDAQSSALVRAYNSTARGDQLSVNTPAPRVPTLEPVEEESRGKLVPGTQPRRLRSSRSR